MAVEVEKLLVRLEAQTQNYNAALLKAQQTTNQQLAGIERRFAATSRHVGGSACRATIRMRMRDNQDENPVWGERRRA